MLGLFSQTTLPVTS
ncbi:hypothetical protein BsWGS_13290 [Bradybaena similaris]